MTPVRSVAVSVVALGLASTLTAPVPAFATPAPCQLVDHYAAQAGAQVLRINRLDLGPLAIPGNRRGAPDGRSADGPARSDRGPDGPARSDRGPDGPARSDRGPAKPEQNPAKSERDPAKSAEDEPAGTGVGGREERGTGGSGAGIFGPTSQSISGVGLGDSRTVVIADNPIHSAAAARLLDGRVAGTHAGNDLVVQQAPPHNHQPTFRRTAEKRFGPLRAGAGELTAHARWNKEVECATAEASTSSAGLRRINLTGAGNESLLRVPEKISGLSSTALRDHDGEIASVASATLSAGRISLADGEVRIRVLRAPTLQVSMSVTGKHRVDYRPAVIEVSGKNIPTKRLETVRDHLDITLSDEVRKLESVPALIKPIGPLPLPPISDLPTPGEPETTPAPPRAGGTKLRIALGDVRQASKGTAVAARADAIKISLVRDQKRAHDDRVKPGYGPSSMVADFAIGLLEGAAVAPKRGSGVASGVPSGVASGVSSGVSPAGSGAGAAGLPITGPRAVAVALSGVALLLGGIGAVLLASRKRRLNP